MITVDEARPPATSRNSHGGRHRLQYPPDVVRTDPVGLQWPADQDATVVLPVITVTSKPSLPWWANPWFNRTVPFPAGAVPDPRTKLPPAPATAEPDTAPEKPNRPPATTQGPLDPANVSDLERLLTLLREWDPWANRKSTGTAS